MSDLPRGYDETIRRVTNATSLEDALHLVVDATHHLSVWSAYLGGIDDHGDGVVYASYAPGGSALEPGTTIATTLTPQLEQLALDLMSGKAVISHMDGSYGMLSDILLREGAVAGINLPLLRDGELMAILSVMCTEKVTPSQVELDRLRLLAEGIAEPIIRLLDADDASTARG